MNLQDHISRYLELVGQAEALFETVQRSYKNLMACRAGCDDCCHVYFKVSLIEAFVISTMFRQNLSSVAQERVLARSEKAAPLFREAETLLLRRNPGANEDLLEIASKIRIPCPLNEDHTCALYAHRPITCRLYGTPQKIADRVVSCPKCGFSEGAKYMTVDVNEIQRQLYEYSRELLKDLIGIDVPAPGPGYSLPETLRTVFDKNFFLTLGDSF
jgi:Fe-S-cluster containining protein